MMILYFAMYKVPYYIVSHEPQPAFAILLVYCKLLFVIYDILDWLFGHTAQQIRHRILVINNLSCDVYGIWCETILKPLLLIALL